jgi:CubicO group peptidase (beta-lactamase class C family)
LKVAYLRASTRTIARNTAWVLVFSSLAMPPVSAVHAFAESLVSRPALAQVSVRALEPLASDAVPHTDAANTKTKAFIEVVEREVPLIMRAARIKAAAVGLIAGGKLVYAKGFGFADHDGKIPATADTIFLAASLAKPVAAATALKLAEEGKLTLDAPIAASLSPWPLSMSAHDHTKITIEQLLSHTAGLSLHGYRGWGAHRELPSLEESLNGKTNGAGKTELIDAPGRRWRYSGGGYTLMQLAIERQSMEDFPALARRLVFEPLGMKRSSLAQSESIVRDAAQGHGDRGEPIPMRFYREHAASSLTTTVNDFATFMIAGMHRPTHEVVGFGKATQFSAQVREAMQTPAPVTLGVLVGLHGYGLGLYSRKIADGSLVVEHDGRNQAGFRAMFAFRPAQADGIVFLSNSRTGLALDRIVCLWREAIAPSNPANPCEIQT